MKIFKVEKRNNSWQVYADTVIPGMTLSVVAAFAIDNKLAARVLADALNETLSVHKKADNAIL